MKFFKFVLPLFLVLILTGCTPKTNQAKEINYVKYFSEKMGMGFSYPENWNVFDNKPPFLGLNITPLSYEELVKNGSAIGISVQGPLGNKSTRPEEWMTTKFDMLKKGFSNAYQNVTEERVVINGVEMRKLSALNTDIPIYDGKQKIKGDVSKYHFIYNGAKYEMSTYCQEDRKELSVVLDRIVNSIYFNQK